MQTPFVTERLVVLVHKFCGYLVPKIPRASKRLQTELAMNVFLLFFNCDILSIQATGGRENSKSVYSYAFKQHNVLMRISSSEDAAQVNGVAKRQL